MLIDKFRCYIVDSQGRRRSQVWLLFSHRNDVYLATRAHSQSMKLSLHERGVARDGNDSQIGLTGPFFRKQVEAGHAVNFGPFRWRRQVPAPGRPAHAGTVYLPTDALPDAHEPPALENKYVLAIPMAPAGGAVCIGLFFLAAEDVSAFAQGQAKAGAFAVVDRALPNGQVLVLVVVHRTEFTVRINTEAANSGFRALSGSPSVGETVSAGMIGWGDIPTDGGPIELFEVTGLTVTRNAPAA